MRYAVSSYAHNINRRDAAMTIKEIANSLGVSTATVSNVIHGHLEKMSPETAQLVPSFMRAWFKNCDSRRNQSA